MSGYNKNKLHSSLYIDDTRPFFDCWRLWYVAINAGISIPTISRVPESLGKDKVIISLWWVFFSPGKEKSAFSSASRPQSVGRDQPCLKSPSMRPACLLLTSAQMRPACLLLTSDPLPAESGCLTGLHNSLSPKSSWEGSPRALLKLSLAQAKTPKLCRRARTVLATRKERKPSWFHWNFTVILK